MSELDAKGVFRPESPKSSEPPMGQPSTRHGAAIDLFELVTVHGIVQKVSEVRKQAQVIVQKEG
jgi:hypothetical protein